MKKFYKKEEYVYMDLAFTMSTKQMADVLYAAIETDAKLPNFWYMNRGEFTRKQSSRHRAWAKVHIHPDEINNFEELTGLKLEEPIQFQLN